MCWRTHADHPRGGEDVKDASTKCLPAIKALTDAAYRNGWYVYGATSSSYEEVEQLRHDNQLAFDFTTCDEVTLKTMIRSNPGIVLLQQGQFAASGIAMMYRRLTRRREC